MALSGRIKVIGDRLLVRQQKDEKTTGGIIIPDSAKNNEDTNCGIVVRIGPGFLSPQKEIDVESWMSESTPEAHYVPLQIKPDYKVVYFKKMAAEVQIDGQTYYVIPQSAVLLYDEDPFGLEDTV